MRSPRAVSVCLVALLASAACGPKGHSVQVSALRDPKLVGRTYWLVNGAGGGEGGLEYRAVAALADRALRARGYQPVDRTTEPHLVIRLEYGVGPPETVIEEHRKAFAYPTARMVNGNRTAYGTRVETEARTVFGSWIRLTAVEGSAFVGGRPDREVWTTTASIYANTGDLQSSIPILLAGAMDFFGASTPRAQRVEVPDGSQRVAWLTGGVR